MPILMKKLVLGSCVAALAALSACSTSSPDVIKREDAQRMSQIQDATVLSVRPVTVDGSQSGVGAVAGGVVGAVAGASVGGRREGQIVGVLGAVAGAVVGNAVERNTTREEAVEVIVQLRNGERRSVVQAKGNENLSPGEAVILVSTGGKTRVSRAPAITAPSAASASNN
ncbi:outer membrane lipoprotein SlyB [Paucibacter oligotrophus]|uniref:Outer membrane lipoprotein SlyB n=1 Tax=Roseateles oligotrophus TaxID=1769250 RepID=A0A840LF36_9BURK|nr:glycine zipper 2TM domain-containing protein [Roseateles oligotrophus]MBB4844808.1 outer membrane lipoprotein SlyB [Roseateles oligotrophus]